MVPALIELHLHLDGSLNLPWAYQTALKRKAIDKDMTFEDFYHILYRKDYKTREEGFRKFEITCDCMQTSEDLHDSIYLLIKELNDLGIIYAEIRFAPQQHCKLGLNQDEVTAAVIAGLNDGKRDYPNVHAYLLLCMMHKGDRALFNDLENRETVNVAEKYLGKGVVGLDLAGYENNCPLIDYAYLFEIAKAKNIPYTIHAAEMGNGGNILYALSMHPNRIGHGFCAEQNAEWVKKLKDEKMVLELCLTSNCNHGIPYADHPARRFIKEGLKVTFNSDNMMFSNTCASHEFLLLSRLGVSDEELTAATFTAIEAAFCSEEEKALLRTKAKEIYKLK